MPRNRTYYGINFLYSENADMADESCGGMLAAVFEHQYGTQPLCFTFCYAFGALALVSAILPLAFVAVATRFPFGVYFL